MKSVQSSAMRRKPRPDHPFEAVRGRGAAYGGMLPTDRMRLGFPTLHCRTLADMTEAEIVAIEHEYGCPVIRPQR